MKNANYRAGPVLVVLITLAISLFLMSMHLRNNLQGNIDFHFLPATIFGVPQELAERGIQPLYTGAKDSGWDGQFYYYIANDLLGVKDTPLHIDAAAYRYQRIGLPLLTRLAAYITLQDWVSPSTYYFTYLALVLLAAGCAAHLFSAIGIHPLWALLWSLGVGTQVTLMNALPDASADAFLILAIAALYFRRLIPASLALTMSALSREAYVLFPVLIGALQLFDYWYRQRTRDNPLIALLRWCSSREAVALAVPIIVFALWQLYVRTHFGVTPSSQAHNILGPPFLAWLEYLTSGLRGRHLLVPSGTPSYAEACSLLAFMALLGALALLAGRTLILTKNNIPFPLRSIAATALLLCALYACFGSTVIMHYTGYMKAGTLFFFLIPLLLSTAQLRHWQHSLVLFGLICVVAGTDVYLWKDRIDKSIDNHYGKYTRANEITATTPVACLDRYDAAIDVQGFEDIAPTTRFSAMLGQQRVLVIWTNVTNKSGQPFTALNGRGSVNMSYHWLQEDGKTVVKDGIRTLLPEGLAPDATSRVAIVVEFPSEPGRYILRLTPVQEGCAWFYMANPASAKDLIFQLK